MTCQIRGSIWNNEEHHSTPSEMQWVKKKEEEMLPRMNDGTLSPLIFWKAGVTGQRDGREVGKPQGTKKRPPGH